MGLMFPFVYDLFMKPLEVGRFKKIRMNLLNKAHGRVLEIGSGTGVNFPMYKDVAQVDAIEPSLFMRTKSLKRIDRSTVPIQIYLVKAEKLPFPKNTFDTVVGTLVFCTIPDPKEALVEIKRVSKPEARVLLFEHVKLEQPFLAKMQDKLTPYWKRICDGCHLNRDTVSLLEECDFEIENIHPYFNGLFIVIECSIKEAIGSKNTSGKH
jgi:ubiquinone/menaquinone biosynthesis C-methylase UbiE